MFIILSGIMHAIPDIMLIINLHPGLFPACCVCGKVFCGLADSGCAI